MRKSTSSSQTCTPRSTRRLVVQVSFQWHCPFNAYMSPHLPAAAVVLSPARVQQAIYILARPRALSAVFCCPSLLSSLGRKERGNGGSLPRRGSMIFSLPENAGRTCTDHVHQATPCNKHYVFHIMRPASWVLYTYYQHQHHGHILHNVQDSRIPGFSPAYIGPPIALYASRPSRRRRSRRERHRSRGIGPAAAVQAWRRRQEHGEICNGERHHWKQLR